MSIDKCDQVAGFRRQRLLSNECRAQCCLRAHGRHHCGVTRECSLHENGWTAFLLAYKAFVGVKFSQPFHCFAQLASGGARLGGMLNSNEGARSLQLGARGSVLKVCGGRVPVARIFQQPVKDVIAKYRRAGEAYMVERQKQRRVESKRRLNIRCPICLVTFIK